MVNVPNIIARLRADLEQLRDADPNGWPETLAELAGDVGNMRPWTMDLFCDAATQVAATAHRLANERGDELEPDEVGLN